jgi:hypothetical protein
MTSFRFRRQSGHPEVQRQSPQMTRSRHPAHLTVPVVKATDHELGRASCVRQRAAILAGAPRWPVDPLQV